MNTLFARLIVMCGWEGETWAFYFQATRKQFEYLSDLINNADELDDDEYTLEELNLPLEALLFIIDNADIGATEYTAQHSFIGSLVELPDEISQISKVGITDFTQPLTVTVGSETVSLDIPGLQYYLDMGKAKITSKNAVS